VTTAPAATRAAAPAYAFYALGVLVLAYVLAFVDRQVLNLLVEPLKRELGLSDLQVSLLQGPAFALFLSAAGLPLGRLIDRARRLTVLTLGVAAWSLAAAACGLAPTYLVLLACRIGVGAGEAVMTPSAYSLIGDWFRKERQGLAAGLYSMGAYLGSGLALIGGGALVSASEAGGASGWRLAFLATGVLGLPVALWVASLREPERGGPTRRPPPWREAVAWVKGPAGAAAGVVNAAVALAAMASYALAAWIPSTLIRRFHLPAKEAGLGFGLVVVTAGVPGTLLAGVVGDALRARGVRDGRLKVLAAASLIATPFAAAAPIAPSPGRALALLWPLVFLATVAVGSGPASLQDVTPARLRGVQHALAVLAVNLFGLGLGPPLVALVTDAVLRDEAKVGLALASTTPVMLGLSAVAAWFGRNLYRRALTDAA
jgi:MFS family permease